MRPEFVKRLLYILASFLFFSTTLSAATAAAANELVLESIEVIAGNDKPEQVVFKLNGSHTPKSFGLNGDNPRLVFDFLGVKYPSEVTRISDVGGNIIAGVRVGRHDKPPKTRVVVDIQQDSPYLHEQVFNVSNNSLVVTLTPDIAEISKQQEPTSKPPRIEADSAKVVHSGSQTKPESEPRATDVQESAPRQETPVGITATSPEKVKESATSSPDAKTDTSSVPAPLVQPSKPSITDQQTQAAKSEQPAEPPVIDEKEPSPGQDTPAEITATPSEQIKESATSAPEAKTDTPSPPSPPVQPSEPSGTDQQMQVAKPEPPAEPRSTETADIIPVLLDVSFEKSINESETVLFRLNHFYPPLVFGIEKGEPRVVCDFFDAEIDENIPPVIEAGGQFVDRIMVTNESDPDKVRVELVLMPNRNYDLQQLFFKEDNLFVVIVKELQEDSAAAN